MKTKEKTKKRGRPKKSTESKKDQQTKLSKKPTNSSNKDKTEVSRKKRLLPHNLLLELDKLRHDIDLLSEKIDSLKNT